MPRTAYPQPTQSTTPSPALHDDRLSHILLVVDNMLDEHRSFVEDQEATVITQQLWEAVEETIEVFETGSIPGNCRDLWHATQTLQEYWRIYVSEVETIGNPAHMPGNGVWSAVENIRRLRAKSNCTPLTLEPIPELVKQKLSEAQICNIYEWHLPNGQPDVDKLREEIAKPGTHTGEGFVPPAERHRQTREAERTEAIERLRLKQQQKLAALSAPPPESIGQLAEEGLSAKQIANMHHITPEQVWEECDNLGIHRPPLDYDPTANDDSQFDPEPSEESKRTTDAFGGGFTSDEPTSSATGPDQTNMARRPAPSVDELFKGGSEGTEKKEEPGTPEAKDSPPAKKKPASKPAGKSTRKLMGDYPITPGLTPEQRVVELSVVHQLKPRRISAHLLEDGIKMSEYKVRTVLKKFKEHPEEFALDDTD
tara:strand:+ start:3239 stop:4513 length:1275 start_codon:yes stop_codon:yes gene_type:complete